jgi:hypothetical protein
VAVDCAASEFDTPPEVFSKTYRRLRESGMQHFTYHAGEDFFHILSGLRAIYEAIQFLDLRRGDRIGHATACGVSIDLWKSNLGETLLIRQGEYMDDLLFAYHLIAQSENDTLKHLLPKLALRIENYAFNVYEQSCPIVLLEKAWLSRGDNPDRILDDKTKDDEVWKLFTLYHNEAIRTRYDKVLEVPAYDILSREELESMQKMLLQYMFEHTIVIETLPTSNVLIGHHHNYSSYHLCNWIRWSHEGFNLPPIVVGSDDVGIFATNIYNEYCNIYCLLKKEMKMNHSEIMRVIEQLDHNAELYRFAPQNIEYKYCNQSNK